MLIACGIPIGITVYILKRQEKKINDLDDEVRLLGDALIDHMEVYYQSKVDDMFSMLMDGLDDE